MHHKFAIGNQINKGRTPWNKGKIGLYKCSEETKIKIRNKLLGRPSPTKGKPISKEHIEALRQSRLGKPNYWKGGKVMSNGYILIHKPKHPFRNSSGYVRRSRLVMEKYLGRYLKPFEKIHHRNGNKTNDVIRNLRIYIKESDHKRFHKNLVAFNIT